VSERPMVLVIEDDAYLQSIVEHALSDAGFEAAIVASAEEAVTLLRVKLGKCWALVTETNPKGSLSGWDIAKAAREIDPDFPIIYIADTAANDQPIGCVPNSITIKKPFAPVQLVTAVSRLLHGAKYN
jgi:DNA-binding NtrC family response regulator